MIAGSSGLNRPIEGTGIVDWEFVHGIENETVKFDCNTFVISSLLFAKDNPSLIYDAIKKLILSGVSAMAYKDIFIKKLPKEVIMLANNNNFPIFVFATAYFEDILVDVHNTIYTADQLKCKSEALQLLLNSELSKNEIQNSIKKIGPYIRENVFAAYLYRKSCIFMKILYVID